jgi:hypothetical protein
MIAMKYCRKTWASKFVGWLCMLVLVPLGSILLIIGICFLADYNVLASILAFLIGMFFLLFGIKECSFELRKYLITSEGLYLGGKHKSFYSWDKIHEIGIFYFDAAASLQIYDKVICCFFSVPSDNINQALFRNLCFYAQRNQKRFVIIDYDEATISALSNVYSKNIMNYMEGMKGHIRNDKH